MPLGANRIAADTVSILNDVLSQALYDRDTYDLTTAADINAMLGLERMKDAVGCASNACIAEIGGALGVDLVLTGTVGRLGGELILTLSLLRTKGQMSPLRVQITAADDERHYRKAADTAVAQLMLRSGESSATKPVVAQAPQPSSQAATPRVVRAAPAQTVQLQPPLTELQRVRRAKVVAGWTTAAIGVAAALSGGAFALLAPKTESIDRSYEAYVSAPSNEQYQAIHSQIDKHNTFVGVGSALLGLAGALGVTSLILFTTSPLPAGEAVATDGRPTGIAYSGPK